MNAITFAQTRAAMLKTPLATQLTSKTTTMIPSRRAFSAAPFRGQRSSGVVASASGGNFFSAIVDQLKEGKKKFAQMQAGDYDEVAINKEIDGMIAQNPVMMFSFVRCPYCIKAKETLDGMGVKYKVVEVDEIPQGMAIRAELGARTGRTSMPSIWIQGKSIGGCNDGTPGLMPLKNSGELVPMLKAAGAL